MSSGSAKRKQTRFRAGCVACALARLGQDIEKMMDLLFDAKVPSVILRLLTCILPSGFWPQAYAALRFKYAQEEGSKEGRKEGIVLKALC